MVVGTLKLYFLFVVFPQVLWIFSNLNRFSVGCEDCSFAFPYSIHSGGAKKVTPPSAAPVCAHLQERDDEITAKICSCEVTNGQDQAESVELKEQDSDDEHGGW